MTRKPLLSFVSLALLSGSIAIAQQIPPEAPPAPPHADGRPGDRGPQDGKRGRDTGGMRFEGGMHSSFGIAPPGMWWKNPDLIQALTLTADQQKHMDDIFQQSRIQLIHLHASLEEAQVILEPMLAANPLDTAKVTAQLDKIADTRADLEKANTKMLLGLRSVLTPDQWTKLQTEERSHRRMSGPGMQGERPEHSEVPSGQGNSTVAELE